MVGGMIAEHILERLIDGIVVIVPADRVDVLLALVNAHEAEGFPSLAGIIMNGGLMPHPAIERLMAGLKPRLPILTTHLGTFDTASAAARTRGLIGVGSQRKVDTALSLMERRVDADALLRRIEVPIPSVMTPQLFEYRLLDRARRDSRHIVLPEGDDDRVLRAAGRVLQRGIARSDPARRRDRGARAGRRTRRRPRHGRRDRHADLPARRAVRRRVRATARTPRHDGRSCARNHHRRLVFRDDDGALPDSPTGWCRVRRTPPRTPSGPSFEIIKTEPGVSTVSSIFLMCLSDRVLAYGDCAVVPDPDASQLADIAISSAHTATQFGIEPRIAMLSYSTGASGSGADVEKVREATLLVQSRRPDLLVEGPIQYDAAIEPTVASTKLPGSKVAGRATVFIFPDLNTGNNTYKAVQRSAGAVAIGPVLQGLRKPVNDLSRGALVTDIVNTIAITAIQAQGAQQ